MTALLPRLTPAELEVVAPIELAELAKAKKSTKPANDNKIKDETKTAPPSNEDEVQEDEEGKGGRKLRPRRPTVKRRLTPQERLKRMKKNRNKRFKNKQSKYNKKYYIRNKPALKRQKRKLKRRDKGKKKFQKKKGFTYRYSSVTLNRLEELCAANGIYPEIGHVTEAFEEARREFFVVTTASDILETREQIFVRKMSERKDDCTAILVNDLTAAALKSLGQRSPFDFKSMSDATLTHVFQGAGVEANEMRTITAGVKNQVRMKLTKIYVAAIYSSAVRDFIAAFKLKNFRRKYEVADIVIVNTTEDPNKDPVFRLAYVIKANRMKAEVLFNDGTKKEYRSTPSYPGIVGRLKTTGKGSKWKRVKPIKKKDISRYLSGTDIKRFEEFTKKAYGEKIVIKRIKGLDFTVGNRVVVNFGTVNVPEIYVGSVDYVTKDKKHVFVGFDDGSQKKFPINQSKTGILGLALTDKVFEDEINLTALDSWLTIADIKKYVPAYEFVEDIVVDTKALEDESPVEQPTEDVPDEKKKKSAPTIDDLTKDAEGKKRSQPKDRGVDTDPDENILDFQQLELDADLEDEEEKEEEQRELVERIEPDTTYEDALNNPNLSLIDQQELRQRLEDGYDDDEVLPDDDDDEEVTPPSVVDMFQERETKWNIIDRPLNDEEEEDDPIDEDEDEIVPLDEEEVAPDYTGFSPDDVLPELDDDPNPIMPEDYDAGISSTGDISKIIEEKIRESTKTLVDKLDSIQTNIPKAIKETVEDTAVNIVNSVGGMIGGMMRKMVDLIKPMEDRLAEKLKFSGSEGIKQAIEESKQENLAELQNVKEQIESTMMTEFRQAEQKLISVDNNVGDVLHEVDNLTQKQQEVKEAVNEGLNTLNTDLKEGIADIIVNQNANSKNLADKIAEVSDHLSTLITNEFNSLSKDVGALQRDMNVLSSLPGDIGELNKILDEWLKEIHTSQQESLNALGVQINKVYVKQADVNKIIEKLKTQTKKGSGELKEVVKQSKEMIKGLTSTQKKADELVDLTAGNLMRSQKNLKTLNDVGIGLGVAVESIRDDANKFRENLKDMKARNEQYKMNLVSLDTSFRKFNKLVMNGLQGNLRDITGIITKFKEAVNKIDPSGAENALAELQRAVGEIDNTKKLYDEKLREIDDSNIKYNSQLQEIGQIIENRRQFIKSSEEKNTDLDTRFSKVLDQLESFDWNMLNDLAAVTPGATDEDISKKLDDANTALSNLQVLLETHIKDLPSEMLDAILSEVRHLAASVDTTGNPDSFLDSMVRDDDQSLVDYNANNPESVDEGLDESEIIKKLAGNLNREANGRGFGFDLTKVTHQQAFYTAVTDATNKYRMQVHQINEDGSLTEDEIAIKKSQLMKLIVQQYLGEEYKKLQNGEYDYRE